MKTMTRDELRIHDGRDGRPAYIAFMGMVYDVSDSPLWKNGMHQALHRAGTDVSRELARAPHGAGIMGRFRVVARFQE